MGARRIAIFILSFVAFGSHAMAGDCENLVAYTRDAESRVVTSFKAGDIKEMEKALDDMLFWDYYLQIECGGGKKLWTPVQWLSYRQEPGLVPHGHLYLPRDAG